MAEAGRKQTLAGWVWVLVAGLALFELVAHPAIRARVPDDDAWREAAAFVRRKAGPSDRVVAAPAWADPLIRRELGDLMTLRAAAPPDDAGVERVWELGIRGATTRTDPPALEERLGPIHVRMWPIAAPTLVYDFVEHVPSAEVTFDAPEGERPCPWTRGPPDPGGLERGPMRPADRFQCDPKRPWAWVGPTVLADLDLAPRRCIWQHPIGERPIRTRFSDVPLGDEIVVSAGVDYQVARQRTHAPVTLRVFIDDRLAGELVHRDGDGWTSLAIDTADAVGRHANVRFETTTSNPSARLFCYAASTQSGGARD